MAGDASRDGSIRILPIRSERLLAICGKCGRKIDGGFGPRRDKALAKALRRVAVGAKGKRAKLRIVETRCLDICPKRAVAVIDSANPGQVIVVPVGTSVDAVAARIGMATV